MKSFVKLLYSCWLGYLNTGEGARTFFRLRKRVTRMNFRSGPNLATKSLLFAAIVIGGSIFVGSTGSPAESIKNTGLCPPMTATSSMAEFYVAPGGNDSGAGTSTDPFQTIYRAQQAVRAIIAGTMTGNV